MQQHADIETMHDMGYADHTDEGIRADGSLMPVEQPQEQQQQQQQEQQKPQGEGGVYENFDDPRATLRISSADGLSSEVQDFFFDDFDPDSEDNNCFFRCLVKFDITRAILQNYGFRAVAAISSVYFCVKGVSSGALSIAYFPLLKKRFKVTDANLQQEIQFIAQLAWPLKPICGIISDNYPIAGYRKKWYLVGFTFTAMVCLLAIYLTPAGESFSVQLVTALLFFLNVSFAGADLITESTYARYMVLRREGGTSIISWVWGLFLIAGVIAAAVVGPVADEGDPSWTFLMLLPFCFIAFVLLYKNWLGERRVVYAQKRRRIFDDTEAAEAEADGEARRSSVHSRIRAVSDSRTSASASVASTRQATSLAAAGTSPMETPLYGGASEVAGAGADFERDGGDAGDAGDDGLACRERALPCIFFEKDPVKKKITLFAITMGIAAPVVAAVSLYTAEDGPEVGTFLAIGVTVLLCCLSFVCLPTIVAKALVFMMLKEATYVSTQGPLNYFYTGNENCVPGGPNFDYTQYVTVAAIIGGFAGALGAWIFNRYLTKKTFRNVYWITTTLRVLTCVFDLMIVTRTNIDIGIPDHVMFFLGDAATYQCLYSLDFMPSVLLTSQLCPHGLEASLYAVLAGMSTMGFALAGFLGSYLAKQLHIKTSTDSCDFTNLPQLVLVSHGILPLLAIPLAYVLIPNTIIKEPLTEAQKRGEAPKEGTEAEPLVAQA